MSCVTLPLGDHLVLLGGPLLTTVVWMDKGCYSYYAVEQVGCELTSVPGRFFVVGPKPSISYHLVVSATICWKCLKQYLVVFDD